MTGPAGGIVELAADLLCTNYRLAHLEDVKLDTGRLSDAQIAEHDELSRRHYVLIVLISRYQRAVSVEHLFGEGRPEEAPGQTEAFSDAGD